MTSHENGSGMETSTGEQRIREIIAALYGWAETNPAPAATGEPDGYEMTGRAAAASVSKLRDADS